MKRSGRAWLIVGGAFFAALLAVAIEIARYGGMFTWVESRFPGRCATIALGGSSEDLQIDPQRGIAYLALLDRAKVGKHDTDGDTSLAGTVMLLGLNLAEPAPRAALAYDPPGFRPQGLSLLLRPDSAPRLFAISHPADGTHTVEIFDDRGGGQFFPDATIRDAAFVHPDAIAAVGPRQFYLANDRAALGKWDQSLEFLLRRGSGTIYYYDGTQAHLVAEALGIPAGMALSPDTSRLYVGEVLGKRLRIFARDPVSGGLTAQETIALGSAPDNLNVDPDGVVWIATRPKLMKFYGHARDATKRAPTQVLRFDPRPGKPKKGAADTRLSQVYADTGEQIAAGTVAAHWRDEFLIGALRDRKVLACKPAP